MLRSNILKLSLFATGLSGIVAEYILSTLATYFVGDSIRQWTLILSIMLFSMGLGSRITKILHNNLLHKFIYMELQLSLLVAYALLIAYTSMAYTNYDALVIYSLSIAIGLLIGMEIPLVVRLNEEFEDLRINISAVMEKDYFGSLVGGLFFAFVGLPYLGLTYTPFVLGFVNFLVAMILLYTLWQHLQKKEKNKLASIAGVVGFFLILGFYLANPIILFEEQKRYKDKIIYKQQSAYQRIVITQWQNDYWLFINGNQQLSTMDEVMYHEPLVHPVMSLHGLPKNILVLGGGDGCAVREILKYKSVDKITLVDLDPAMTDVGCKNPIFVKLNKNSMNSPKLTIINQDGYTFLENVRDFYDVIIVDLPDPRTVELGRLYSYEFYKLCYKKLRPNGFLITQAGTPYYATKAFMCIDKTMEEADFTTVPLHNQVLTLGEWGWVLGAKNVEKNVLQKKLRSLKFENVETEWINNEAMHLITSFGKNFFLKGKDKKIEINKIHNPVLYRYYLKGNWDLY